MCKENGCNRAVFGAVLLAVGAFSAVSALLMANKTGKELREDISEKAKKACDAVTEKAKKLCTCKEKVDSDDVVETKEA